MIVTPREHLERENEALRSQLAEATATQAALVGVAQAFKAKCSCGLVAAASLPPRGA